MIGYGLDSQPDTDLVRRLYKLRESRKSVKSVVPDCIGGKSGLCDRA